MPDQTPEISLETFAAERENGVTIDVREREEFAQAHVPRAVLAPMGQLAARLDDTAAMAAVVGARVADRVDTRRLSAAFAGLVLAVAAYTATQALSALFQLS